MIGIVVSRADPASERIGDALRELVEWEHPTDIDRPGAPRGGEVHRHRDFELRTFDDLHLELEAVADVFGDPEVVIFVSKHAGDTGRLLSTHFPGNVASAAYGGSDRELPLAAPETLRDVFDGLCEERPEGYEVGIECTHHGPSRVGAPCLFAEVGSSSSAWNDEEAARAVARVVLSLSAGNPTGDRTVVGFGGGHYAPRFERLLRETDWRIGHIAADWGLDELTDETERRSLVKEVFDCSGATMALIDGDRPEIVNTIESLGYRVVSETWLREADGVALEVVEAVEKSLGPIDEGTRLGTRSTVAPEEIREATLPAGLIEEIQRIDRAAAVRAVAERTVAYGTSENGNRLTGELLLPEKEAREAVISAAIELIEPEYDSVVREDAILVVEERSFDPEAASALGVPDGPAFGELAAGRPVEVGERTVEPAEVFKSVSRRIPLSDD